MDLNILSVPSFWVPELKQKLFKIEKGNSKLVVLFPGKNFSCDKPCLHYAATMAFQSGYDVLVLEYGYQAARTDLDIKDLTKIIDESEACISQIVHEYEQLIFISKSLGTIVAGEVEKRLNLSLKQHIYLTPLQDTIPYINSSNSIVVYGTNDPLFNKELAEKIKDKTIIEYQNANHSLETNDVEESINIIQSLIRVYKEVFKS